VPVTPLPAGRATTLKSPQTRPSPPLIRPTRTHPTGQTLPAGCRRRRLHLKDTDELSGETDTEATAVAKDYAGFTENTSHASRVTSGTIAGDESLVLKLYYDRDLVTVTFKDFDEITVLKTETVRYEGSVMPPSDPTRLGYTFNGWSGTYSTVTSDQTVLATYSPNTTTRYKVEHYQQDITGDGYTLKETENLTGTTDTTVTASAKSYTGFSENTPIAAK
jgi:uncharacterized repeat protein (TIGR02543 family)